MEVVHYIDSNAFIITLTSEYKIQGTGEIKILVVVLKLGLKHSQKRKRGQWWLRWLYQILDIVLMEAICSTLGSFMVGWKYGTMVYGV